MQAKLISFVVSGVSRARKGKKETAPSSAAKSAPRYFGTAVPQRSVVKQEATTVDGREGLLILKTYQPDMLLAEVRMELPDVFGEEVIALKEAAIAACRAALTAQGGKDVATLSEEYTVYAISHYSGEPEQFLTHRARIAGLLKSEKIALDPHEIDYTIASQIKYAKNDLVLVDWDGAFLFDPEGDIEPTVELLELANLQLLRYRMLDGELDERLHRVAALIEQAPAKRRFLFKAADIDQALKNTILARSSSISEFQALEREIKLIGDWYFARLYDLVAKKFRMEEWRKTVKEKLEALESIYTIAAENFTISWERRGRLIEFIGWYALLAGWFIFLAIEFYLLKR